MVDIAQVPLTEGEILALVPPASTRQTGINCAALALYGAKLISADFVKYYSDTLAQAFEKLKGDQAALMKIDDEQIPELDYIKSTFGTSGVLSSLMADVLANVDNSASGGMFDMHGLLPQDQKIPGRRSAVQSFRVLADQLRPGHGVSIQFTRPPAVGGFGAHAVVLWKHPDGKRLAILDFQRGKEYAGDQMNTLYASWVGSPLGAATHQRSNVLIISAEDYTASGVIESVFVEYMIQQGLAWSFYTDEGALRRAGGPAVGVLGFYRRNAGTPVTIHPLPHRNGDTYTPEFKKALATPVVLMDTAEETVVQTWFRSELGKAPIRFVRRDTIVPVSVTGSTYIRDTVTPSQLHQVLQALPDNTILAVRETIPDPTKRGGRRRKTRRLPKRRKTRRAPSTIKFAY